MITRHVAGGAPITQAVVGTLGTITTITISLAYYNIKRLQIDQHRAWMLRTWVYAGSIITLRFILAAAMAIIPSHDFYDTQSCAQIYFGYAAYGISDSKNPTSLLYPQCGSNASTSTTYVAVKADQETPEGFAASYNLSFGMSAFIALLIHAIGVEVYLSLTPAETVRLREVSAERQAKAKFRTPGHPGLTERVGDTNLGTFD